VSAMENMAKNILASMIPPQVMAMITSENMEAIMIRAKAFVEQQDRIEKKLDRLLELENDRDRNNGKRPRLANRASGPGNGDAGAPD